MRGPGKSPMECSDCSRPACCYEKDSSPRRFYCGRHGAQWTKRGIHIIQAPWLTRTTPASAPADGAEPEPVAEKG